MPPCGFTLRLRGHGVGQKVRAKRRQILVDTRSMLREGRPVRRLRMRAGSGRRRAWLIEEMGRFVAERRVLGRDRLARRRHEARRRRAGEQGLP